jgi:nucleotide-binding universal stress UspA family protein
MIRHLLIPTDGSALSLKAARVGADLALQLKARVTALYVHPPYTPPYVGDGLYFTTLFSEKEYMTGSKLHAEKMLARVEAILSKKGVKCGREAIMNATAWEGIIKGAVKLKADLIVMASHGRSGLSGVVLGSQTNRVLTHSKIPVLVCR